jgi:hypothetical protein
VLCALHASTRSAFVLAIAPLSMGGRRLSPELVEEVCGRCAVGVEDFDVYEAAVSSVEDRGAVAPRGVPAMETQMGVLVLLDKQYATGLGLARVDSEAQISETGRLIETYHRAAPVRYRSDHGRPPAILRLPRTAFPLWKRCCSPPSPAMIT